jgi:hypothetical protein
MYAVFFWQVFVSKDASADRRASGGVLWASPFDVRKVYDLPSAKEVPGATPT